MVETEINKTPNPSLIALTALLFTFGCLYSFVVYSGYTFIPVSGLLLNIISGAIVVVLAEKAAENEKTKIDMILSGLLPWIVIFFIVSKGIASSIGIDFYVYAYVVWGSGKIVFNGIQRKIIRILLILTYAILSVSIFLFIFDAMVFSDRVRADSAELREDTSENSFGTRTVAKYSMSPNSVYLAEVWNIDAGATGGSTIVYVIPQRKIHLLIGTLKKDAQKIYSGRWGESLGMTLRWETDEILYINGKEYDIPPHR